MNNLDMPEGRVSRPISLPPIRPARKKRRPPVISADQRKARADRMKRLRQDSDFNAKRIAGIKATCGAMTPEQRRAVSERLKGYESKRVARSRLATAQRFQDPKNVEKSRQITKNLWATGRLSKEKMANRKYTAEGLVRKAAATKRMQDRRRGFVIPRRLRKEYDHLVQTKRMSAREAGILLGLIKIVALPPFPSKSAVVRSDERQSLPIQDLPVDEDVARRLCPVFGAIEQACRVHVNDLRSPRKTKAATEARLLFCWLCRKFTTVSLLQLGAFLGGRDHTTILHAVRRVEADQARFEPQLSQCVRILGGANG